MFSKRKGSFSYSQKPFPTTNKVFRISIFCNTSHQPYVRRIFINVMSDTAVCKRVNQFDR